MSLEMDATNTTNTADITKKIKDEVHILQRIKNWRNFKKDHKVDANSKSNQHLQQDFILLIQKYISSKEEFIQLWLDEVTTRDFDIFKEFLEQEKKL